MEGMNLYHDYGLGNENDDRNTCVNGWCLVMAQTGQYRLQDLATGRIQYFAGTMAKEAEKKKPNLQQRKSKYLNVNEVLEKSEALGFLPLDLDLAQRGDFCVQYYRTVRLREEFGPQHISIIDQIVPWGEGLWELRDWHEGIEGEPFLYRTGTSHPSSYNNVFTPQNIYFGFQLDQGKERTLYTKNPNVCQAFGYFGDNLEAARTLLRQVNYLRAQMYLVQNFKPENLSLGTKP
ncbi:MAG: hypothetical protein HC913_08890 [Microscillaceae bacterium]|nr:hypothetical protein [Microscillaceae bacterium]